jgi:hypothetical protein
MAEKKKVINVRLVKGKRKATRRAKPKEKSKTKQKQKQRQTVNVQVSSGGSGGGGTSFIPMPQAPAFDYSLLANLIRPANTVDMPIRAMSAIPEPVRQAEEPTLAETKKGGGRRIVESETEAEFVQVRESKAEKRVRSEAEKERRRQTDALRKIREAKEIEENLRRSMPTAEAQLYSGSATPAVFIGEK